MNIQFLADSEVWLSTLPKPVSAAKAMPDWLKNMPHTGPDGHYGSETVKKCMPFIDVMNAGYIIPLWCDLVINVDENQESASLDNPPNWDGPKMISDHNAFQIAGSPFSKWTHGNSPMKLNNPWVIKTPPGYSCLFTQPFNQPNETLHVLSAIVDTDTYYNNINFPFILTAGPGQHVIHRGTPIMQVVPFKRETIGVEYGVVDHDERAKVNATISQQFRDGYKRNYRHKKTDASE